jgi:glycosyltransferase involved in cell wall biosynthesis
MRILWQNEHYPDVAKGGGGAINTYYITTAMQRLGHKVVILARGEREASPYWENVKGTTVQRVAPPKLPEKLWPLWPLLEPYYARASLQAVCSDCDAFIGVDFSFALNVKKSFPTRPVIYRVEGNERSHNAAIAALGNGTAAGNKYRQRSFLERCLAAENDLMERRVWRSCDAIVVKSQFMKRELYQWYGVTNRNVFVIPNGVDYDRYAGAKCTPEIDEHLENRSGEKIVIMFCGRLVRMKNVSLLLRAFARMNLRNNCVLGLVGDGEERSSLENEANQLGIRPSVKFVGYTERAEEYLAAADIFVLPSAYEPFGNALVEAMAAGLPCVALKPDMEKIRTASDEILQDGVTGCLVTGHHEELGETLDHLVANAELRKRLGVAAQARCREEYSWESCARAYLSLAEDLGERSISLPEQAG